MARAQGAGRAEVVKASKVGRDWITEGLGNWLKEFPLYSSEHGKQCWGFQQESTVASSHWSPSGGNMEDFRTASTNVGTKGRALKPGRMSERSVRISCLFMLIPIQSISPILPCFHSLKHNHSVLKGSVSPLFSHMCSLWPQMISFMAALSL